AEVLPPRRRAAQCGGRGDPDSDVETVLPGLITDLAAPEQIEVVVAVKEGLDGCRAVGGELGESPAEESGPGSVLSCVSPGRERGHRREQRHCADPVLAVDSKVTDHRASPAAGRDQDHVPGIEGFEQHAEVGGERVVVVARDWTAGIPRTAAVVTNDAVTGVQKGWFLFLPGLQVG